MASRYTGVLQVMDQIVNVVPDAFEIPDAAGLVEHADHVDVRDGQAAQGGAVAGEARVS